MTDGRAIRPLAEDGDTVLLRRTDDPAPLLSSIMTRVRWGCGLWQAGWQK
jgi:hypothetical protein